MNNSRMRSLPLHVKSSILASAISLIVLLVGMIVSSGSLARQIQDEQIRLATLQAENLAEQLSLAPDQFDSDELLNIANIVSGSRPNLFNVRIWKLEDGKFVETVASDDSLPDEIIGDDVQDALLKSNDASSVRQLDSLGGDPLYRIFSPIVENNRVIGAVEAVEKLDTIWSIAGRFSGYLLLILLITVVFIGAAFYLLFQKLVYGPIGKLLDGMELARSGELSVELEQSEKPDEIGLLANNFISMMSQIHEMTTERERQADKLRQEVISATAELTLKNDQLEAANLDLIRATRIMSGMERLAAAGQTAAQFAHEVGTPLNLISGHTQLLQSSLPEGSGDRKRLQIIADQIDRIEKIVHEMLDRTRFGRSERLPIDLNRLIRKTISAMEPTIAERHIAMATDLSADLPRIMGDPDRLQQVFLNLFNNAIDALPKGGDLAISTSLTNDQVVVRFEDSGTGMTDEVSSNIFQPLFTTKERGRGTGLGLYVVKQILDEHDADIRVESALARGTTFQLYFIPIKA